MSEQNKTPRRPDQEPNHAHGDVIGQLIRTAGSRPTAPPAMRAAVEAVARDAWQETWQARRRKRGLTAVFGVAVALLVAVASTLLLRTETPPSPLTVATIDRVAGDAGHLLVNGQTASGGQALSADDIIETGAAVRAGLRLVAADQTPISLRLDADTQLRLISASELRLNRGRVYADTGPEASQPGLLKVVTPLGEATDIGTQFAVSYIAGRMIVGVREGLVEVASEHNAYQTKAQRQSTLLPGGQVSEQELAADDPQWNWLYDIAPRFAGGEQKILAYLRWVARETGRELVFADRSAERIAAAETLSPVVAQLSPGERMDNVLAVAALRYEQRGNAIIVSRR